MTPGTTTSAELAAFAHDTFVDAYADDLDRTLLEAYARDVFVPDLLDELARGALVRVLRRGGRAVAYATAGPDEEGAPDALRLGRLYVGLRVRALR